MLNWLPKRPIAYFRLFLRDWNTLKSQSASNLTIAGSTVTVLGLLADFCEPWYPILSYLFPIVAIAAVFFYWRWRRAQKGAVALSSSHKKQIRIQARRSMRAGIATVVLAPIFVANLAAGDRGVLANQFDKVSHAQDAILVRLDRIDDALRVLNGQTVENAQALNEIKTDTGELKDSLNAVTETTEKTAGDTKVTRETMELSVAYQTIDRVKEARDGSNQGQQLAFESLIKLGHEFNNADLSGISFSNAVLAGGNYVNSQLLFTDFSKANLSGATFDGANLSFADFSAVNASNLVAKSIDAQFLNGGAANFSAATLAESNFAGSHLVGATFYGADLSGVSFAFANLTGADFTGANLTGAFFTGSILIDAKFTDATFSGTNFHGAIVQSGLLSAEQNKQTCRHEGRFRGVNVKLLERWPSSRFSSGYEYDDITEYEYYGKVPTLQSLSLPVCKTGDRNKSGFNASYADQFDIRVDRYFMEYGNRRSAAKQYLENHFGTLQHAYSNETAYSGAGEFKQALVASMRKASECDGTRRNLPLNSDGLLVALLAENKIDPDSVDWLAAAKSRLLLESADPEHDVNMVKSNSHVYNSVQFFPEGTVLSDLPKSTAEHFRIWTLCRMKHAEPYLWAKFRATAGSRSGAPKQDEITYSQHFGSMVKARDFTDKYGVSASDAESLTKRFHLFSDSSWVNADHPASMGLDAAVYLFPHSSRSIGVSVPKAQIPLGAQTDHRRALPSGALYVQVKINGFERVEGKKKAALFDLEVLNAQFYSGTELIYETEQLVTGVVD